MLPSGERRTGGPSFENRAIVRAVSRRASIRARAPTSAQKIDITSESNASSTRSLEVRRRGQERFIPVPAERRIHHTKRPAEVVIGRSVGGFYANAARFDPADAPNLAEVKQRAKTRLSQVQYEVEKLIGRTQDTHLPSIRQSVRHSATKKFVNRHAESH